MEFREAASFCQERVGAQEPTEKHLQYVPRSKDKWSL